MLKRSLKDINKKIKNGEANIVTSYELKKAIKNEEKIKFENVDVITSGTCGIMSGTTAIFHIGVTEPGLFKKAKKIYLNNIPSFPGPCPNEMLGSIDIIAYWTEHSIYNQEYGGGFLFKDILEGKDINVEIEDITGKKFETVVNVGNIP